MIEIYGMRGVIWLAYHTVTVEVGVRVPRVPQMNFSLDARSISKAEHSML